MNIYMVEISFYDVSSGDRRFIEKLITATDEDRIMRAIMVYAGISSDRFHSVQIDRIRLMGPA